MHLKNAQKTPLHECRGEVGGEMSEIPYINKKYAPKFRCDVCDYECSRKFLWTQHCETQKHKKRKMVQMVQNGQNPVVEDVCSETKPFRCQSCGKSYKFRTGLSRHQRLGGCSVHPTEFCPTEAPTEAPPSTDDSPPSTRVDVEGNASETQSQEAALERENGELRNMVRKLVAGLDKDVEARNREREEMVGQLREQSQIIKEMIPRLGNNNNNQLNINVFLNEQCRDAINMTEFIASLQVQLEDLQYTGDNGLVAGVSSVLLNGLRRLETSRRPIHCMDAQKEVLYIKDNNAWNAERSGESLRTAIDDVANKQRKAIAEWEAHNPNWDSTEEGRAQYLRLVRSVMSDISEGSGEKRIIESIAEETALGRGELCSSTGIDE